MGLAAFRALVAVKRDAVEGFDWRQLVGKALRRGLKRLRRYGGEGGVPLAGNAGMETKAPLYSAGEDAKIAYFASDKFQFAKGAVRIASGPRPGLLGGCVANRGCTKRVRASF